MKNNKFLILRRVVQLLILFLFMGSSHYFLLDFLHYLGINSGYFRSSTYIGVNALMGNYSSAFILESFYLADPYAVLQMFATGFIPAVELLIGAGIVVLFYAILGGRLFCSWVCPLNIVTDLASNLRRRFKIKTVIKKANKEQYTKARYYVLLLGLALSFIFGVTAFEMISPISMLHRSVIFGFGFSINIVLIVFVADLLIMPNLWCGHLCPVGAFYSVIGKYSFLKVFHTKENCTLCMKCKVVCPEVQVLGVIGKETKIIKSAECTDCGRCIDVCEDDALHFTILDRYKR